MESGLVVASWSVRSVAAVAVLALSTGAQASVNPMAEFSLISFGNASSSSNNQGRAWIGGNLSGAASDYGTRLTPAANFVTQDVLRVGGNIQVSNINMQAGRVRVGGSVSGNLNFNGGGQRVNDPGTAAMLAPVQQRLIQDSAFYRALQSTAGVTFPSGQPAGVTFNAVPRGPLSVAVFSINAAQLFSSNLVQSIDLNLNGSQAVLINVAGTNVDFSGNANFVGGFPNNSARSRVLWNFFEATNINLRGKAFEGAILAPFAHLIHQGVISGSVVVASISQQSEIHVPTFNAVIPAPSAAAVLGLLCLSAARRRR